MVVVFLWRCRVVIMDHVKQDAVNQLLLAVERQRANNNAAPGLNA